MYDKVRIGNSESRIRRCDNFLDICPQVYESAKGQGDHLIDETEKDPPALQNEEDSSEMTLVLRKENKNLVTSSRKHGRFSLKRHNVVEIRERLKILEEERSTMKKVLVEAVHERKRLIDEIYQQFQQFDTCFLSVSLTTYSPKERNRGRTAIGLSQILGQT